MDNTHNSQEQRKYLFLRDHFAAHRTDIANDRTFLAFIRTALTFFVVGVTFIKFFSHIVIVIIGWILIKEFLEALLRGKKHSVHSVIPAKAGIQKKNNLDSASSAE
jgi:putative membrane protein